MLNSLFAGKPPDNHDRLLDFTPLRQREEKALVELRVPFVLDRDAIDDVERGSEKSDWQPVKGMLAA